MTQHIQKLHDSPYINKTYTFINGPNLGINVKVSEVFDQMGKITLVLNTGDNILESDMGKFLKETTNAPDNIEPGMDALSKMNFNDITIDNKVIKHVESTVESTVESSIEKKDTNVSEASPISTDPTNDPILELFKRNKKKFKIVNLELELKLPDSGFIEIIKDSFDLDDDKIADYIIEINNNEEIKKAAHASIKSIYSKNKKTNF